MTNQSTAHLARKYDVDAECFSLPCYTRRPDGDLLQHCGVSFLARSSSKQCYLILPAHLPFLGEGDADITTDWKKWSPDVFVRPACGQELRINLFISPMEDRIKEFGNEFGNEFVSMLRMPTFTWCGLNSISDLIAIPLSAEAIEGWFPTTPVIEKYCSPVLGETVTFVGFPERGHQWPNGEALARATIKSRFICTRHYDEAPKDPCGYSGAPIIADDGSLVGMSIGHQGKHTFFVPADLIFDLVEGRPLIQGQIVSIHAARAGQLGI